MYGSCMLSVSPGGSTSVIAPVGLQTAGRNRGNWYDGQYEHV